MKNRLTLIILTLLSVIVILLGYQVTALKQAVIDGSNTPPAGQQHSLEYGNIVEDGKVVCSTDALKQDCTPAEQK
jgi:hypothetical protein